MHRYVSLVVVLGYCLIRCTSPALAKPAQSMVGPPNNALDDECTSSGEPCAFVICPGEIFRAICDQFSLVNTDKHPLKVSDLSNESTCCKNKKNCPGSTGSNSTCNVPTTDLVSILKEATDCFKSTSCIIKHPETLWRLEERFCNLTMKMLSGFYYCN